MIEDMVMVWVDIKELALLRAKAAVCDAYMEWDQNGTYARLYSARAALRELENKP